MKFQWLTLTAGEKKILFCGCAHNGILNVMNTLERKFGTGSLPDSVIGGFHLMKRTEFSEADTTEVTEIANRLKSYKSHFATCHCTRLHVFNQMKEIMGDQLTYVRSGDEVVVEY
jgi:7,8-dihydropterin-6-yl-methyl-4-(beta-D-ribofuranosyl)aminobenzene 5'-phosphate synthase